jgi:hypothetical protein
MTPKEKAKELVCKMYGCEINTDLNHIYIINGDGYFIAKDSALIAVNEILKSGIEQDYYFDKSIGYYLSYLEYYEEVKQEIEKL